MIRTQKRRLAAIFAPKGGLLSHSKELLIFLIIFPTKEQRAALLFVFLFIPLLFGEPPCWKLFLFNRFFSPAMLPAGYTLYTLRSTFLHLFFSPFWVNVVFCCCRKTMLYIYLHSLVFSHHLENVTLT